ncbi:MAG TPA: peptidoglycan-binding domain-containing protein [Thermoleophilaceae bacterium]|nr:peptidoglycan-binding domain-containing protein [Thermoleophilaceae bacterium]
MRRRYLLPALALLALLAPAAAHAQAPDPGHAMDGDTMWIWEVKKSSGGSVSAIASKAKRYGIENLVVKGADAGHTWRQFSRSFVNGLRARGLKVCAYQFVYGRRPRTEARAGARISRIADCMVIDAETHYEGRYASARTYMRGLRARLGPNYPLGLTSFPYVHYHPGFPYSVFLGPGAAQFNVPQVYWKAIGHSVDRTLATTYRYNTVYGRTIAPLGQTWMHPRRSHIRRFRQQSIEYGAKGVGWWDWQESAARDWRAVSSPLPVPGPTRQAGFPGLKRRSRGDLVVWAQQHLRAAGESVRVNGVFDSRTKAAVVSFQQKQGLAAGGGIGSATWTALLRFTPARVAWRSSRASAASQAAAGTTPEPRSAKLRPRRNELRAKRAH